MTQHHHTHGTGCGHAAIRHGDHIDYLVDGHQHHPDGDQCGQHGPVDLSQTPRP